jgi:GntR family transcriptional regulator, transcriptional repressor for pyruvate dehydrogenase complex
LAFLTEEVAVAREQFDEPAPKALSTSHVTAAVLREEILALDADGAFLGSEDDLLTRLGVSRPTLRQAARILEQEHLLTVRRGTSGGFFSRLPSTEAVSHVASVYLRSRHTGLRHLWGAARLVAPEIARLAAANPSAEARAEFADFAESPAHEELIGARNFVRDVVREFGLRLVALVDNPPLVLFYEVVLDLAVSPFDVRVFDQATRARQTLEFQRALGECVRRADESSAAARTVEYFTTIESWSEHPSAST